MIRCARRSQSAAGKTLALLGYVSYARDCGRVSARGIGELEGLGWRLGMDEGRDASGGEASGEVGAELRRLRIERGLSLGALARQVHYTKGYLSKVETGDKRVTLDVARRCDEALGTGGVLAALLAGPPVPEGADEEPEPPISDVCPYPGLAAFGPTDARWFFGRAQVTADLLRQLDERCGGGGPLAVVAPSGAGKSSVLAAGLIPALARGALPGSHAWTVVRATPGAHPLATLAARLAALAGVDSSEAAAAAEDPQALPALCAKVAIGGKPWETPSSARLVLLVDQFEETFTECQAEPERRAFISALCIAAQSAAVLVVLGVRADFYGRCLAYPALLGALNEGHLALGAMSADQLREVITGPATAEGLDLEPGLVELLLGDLGAVEDSGVGAAGYDPGALPLLAHALRVTWQQREGHLLTVAGYRRTGGIREAIATTAERVYAGLDPTGQRIAKSVFLRLTALGDGAEVTRRRVSPNELETEEHIHTAKVLERLAAARLITLGQNSIEVAHEALIRAWPRLRQWLTEDRESLRTHRQLTEAAHSWRRLDRDPGALYRGARLAIARECRT